MGKSTRIFAWSMGMVILLTIPSMVFAQEQSGAMRQTTSGGSLEIVLKPTYTEGANGTTDAKFEVNFIDPKTGGLNQHQDYDFIIRQEGNQIFSAAGSLNQPLIHNIPGNLTVPFNFKQNGDYTVEVHLLGLGFPPLPIKPETASFQIVVTPEFPAALVAVVGAVMAGSIALGRRYRLF